MGNLSTTLHQALSSPSFSALSAARVSGLSWVIWLLPAVVAYPLLVEALRFRRIKGMQKRYHITEDHLVHMTDQDAFEIIQQMAEEEFQAMFEKGLQFALFRSTTISLRVLEKMC